MGIRKINILILVVLIILSNLSSCQMFLGEDEKLSIERTTYTGSALNLNGYYYLKSNSGEMVYMFFLFRNGLILNAGGCKIEEWGDYEMNFLDEDYINKVTSLKYNWGVYQIETNKIKYERWYPSERPYKTGLREGRILNDSTFVIEKAITSKGAEIIKKEIYRFKHFSPKLDSISNYIK